MSEEIVKLPSKKRDNMPLSEFIAQANQIHGNRYDYSLIEKFALAIKIPIICKKHGKFEQTAHTHLSGRNCGRCVDDDHKGVNNPTFIKLVKEIQAMNFENVSDIIVIPKSLGTTTSTQVQFTCATHGMRKTSLYRLRSNMTCPFCIWDIKHPNSKEDGNRKLYKKLVWHYTNYHWKQHQGFINHYGVSRSSAGYHIDHIYSIEHGFRQSIPPYIVGHWTNLWMTPAIENSRKGAQCGKPYETLISDYFWAIDRFNQPEPPIYVAKFHKRISENV